MDHVGQGALGADAADGADDEVAAAELEPYRVQEETDDVEAVERYRLNEQDMEVRPKWRQ